MTFRLSKVSGGGKVKDNSQVLSLGNWLHGSTSHLNWKMQEKWIFWVVEGDNGLNF